MDLYNLHDVLLCRILSNLAVQLVSPEVGPRHCRSQGEIGSKPTRALGLKKKVIASGHFHLLPLLTSIHHIHRYSFSAVPLNIPRSFFLDRYVPSSWYIYFSICLSDGFKLLNPMLGILSSRNSPSWTLVLLDPKHRRHLHCQQGYGNIKLEHLG